MEILITHTSALRYWRTNGKAREANKHRQRARQAPVSPPMASTLFKGNLHGLSLPIEITVSSADSRRASQVFKPHVFKGKMPDRCLVNTGEGFLVASPELCFFQMAGELPLARLIELGYELCGTYSSPAGGISAEAPGSSSKTTYNVEPLTDKKKLAAFAFQMSGRHGVKRACRALQYIADSSGSPMETVLAILLVMPFRLGGYGFPLPEMNRRVDPKVLAMKGSGKRFYKCDLLWPDFAVAAEYDSSLFHSDSKSIADDSIRRGNLALSGVDVVTVTDKQVFGEAEFDKTARQLALKLGRRIQIRDSDFTIRRRELRELLL